MTSYKETFFYNKENTTGFTIGDDKRPHESFLMDETSLSPKGRNAVKELKEQGYTIIKGALDKREVEIVEQELQRLLKDGPKGRNHFEGVETRRIYGLPYKTRVTDVIVEHEVIMEILSAFLLPNPLLTACQAIDIGPGESMQPLHCDDAFMNIPRPHRPFSIATMFAVTRFTKDNGGTVVFPGSHLWGNRLPKREDVHVSIEMDPGDACVFLSTLWHGGGANVTKERRIGITAQYCEPWIRPQENFMLGLLENGKRDDLKMMSPRMRSLFGFSIHPPFIGMVDGQHPLKVVGMSESRL